MDKPNTQLYFLSDQYFRDFPDDKLMRNKEILDGVQRKRPFFLAFTDKKNPNIQWLVPISSKTEKYQKIAQKKIEKYGRCNTICFGSVFNRDAAFLIQNICPSTNKYLIPYIDKHKQPVKISKPIALNVIKNAYKVLSLLEHDGINLIYPDIYKIYKSLNLQKDLQNTQSNTNVPESEHETEASEEKSASETETSGQEQSSDNTPEDSERSEQRQSGENTTETSGHTQLSFNDIAEAARQKANLHNATISKDKHNHSQQEEL